MSHKCDWLTLAAVGAGEELDAGGQHGGARTGGGPTARQRGEAPGVTGPDNDQDQTTTTLFGRSLVLKFQDQTMTT